MPATTFRSLIKRTEMNNAATKVQNEIRMFLDKLSLPQGRLKKGSPLKRVPGWSWGIGIPFSYLGARHTFIKGVHIQFTIVAHADDVSVFII